MFVGGCTRRPAGDRVSLRFVDADGHPSEQFSMEVAASVPSRMRGLMYRRALGSREGMIFLFPDTRVQSFWMKNTYIPLDMVFVAPDWRVVGVLENVPPLTEDSRSVGVPSQYVLEFSGGTVRALGVKEGTLVRVEGQLPPIE